VVNIDQRFTRVGLIEEKLTSMEIQNVSSGVANSALFSIHRLQLLNHFMSSSSSVFFTFRSPDHFRSCVSSSSPLQSINLFSTPDYNLIFAQDLFIFHCAPTPADWLNGLSRLLLSDFIFCCSFSS